MKLKRSITLAILAFARRRGETYVRDIIRGTGLSPHTVVKYVKALEEMGLIEVERFGRLKLIRVTEKGKKWMEEYGVVNLAVPRPP
ncbi:MAG: hypothetical protein DRJ96_08365 [Thermoprotei archaeon]|nr:MAG: hypothetical protein DRJ67_09540 [Thermoprotei archaeon]RLE95573.1 MAG: hypothetical protein DRJ96_08365 [Thermoprotei archaeon]